MTMHVWEGGLLETTREQNCFKFSLKNRERRQLSGVLWKLIHAAGPECENARSPNFVRSRGLTAPKLSWS